MATPNIDFENPIDRLKEYRAFGLDEMIHRLVASSPWQPFKGTRDMLHLLVPVDKVYPPNIQPPYELEDKIENTIREIPSVDFKAEGLRDKLYAIKEFDKEIRKYNDKVFAVWKKDGVEDDIEGQVRHELQPRIRLDVEKMLYEFECVLAYGMFDKERKLGATNNKTMYGIGWKTVSNRSFLLWDYLENPTNFEMCLLINTSIYDYMMILKGDRVLDKDDVFYYPIKEFEAWADKHGEIYNRKNTILEYENYNISLEDAVMMQDAEGFKLKDFQGIGIDDLSIELDKAEKTIRLTRGRGNKSVTLKWDTTGLSESRFELLYSYAVFNEQQKLAEDGHLVSLWNSLVVGDRTIETIQKYQREINSYFTNKMELPSIFEKIESDTHPQAGGTDFRYTCLLRLTTTQGNDVVALKKGWKNKDAMTRVNKIERKKNMDVKINPQTGAMEEVEEKKEDIY